jgi:hypothetical protein
MFVGGCSRTEPTQAKSAATPAPPAPKGTTRTFEQVYRAGKVIEGATATGVTYVKYGELLQGLSTELSIAKDQPLNEADKKLVALYDGALVHYRVAGTLWTLKESSV